jgi:deazaflavin-dependent oxidoreductase (nitroreductase family)
VNAVVRRLAAAPSALYDVGLGRLLGTRFLRLTHTGRRSGRRYRTVLEVIGTDGPEVVVMVGFGAGSDWYRNVLADGPAVVETGGRRFRAAHRVLPQAEAVEAVGRYERAHPLVASVLGRVLARVAGVAYDRTATGRMRLLERIPVVGLRPLGTDGVS